MNHAKRTREARTEVSLTSDITTWVSGALFAWQRLDHCQPSRAQHEVAADKKQDCRNHWRLPDEGSGVGWQRGYYANGRGRKPAQQDRIGPELTSEQCWPREREQWTHKRWQSAHSLADSARGEMV